jgi:hypothetical protein
MEPSLVNTIEGDIMKYFLIAMFWTSPLWANEEDPNWYITHCKNQVEFDKTGDWYKLSVCTSKYVIEKEQRQRQEIRDFIRANPRYMYPGQSLNHCFGKPREMPFERSTVTVGPNGMQASVWYKDTIPAGCYETAGWDNRDD